MITEKYIEKVVPFIKSVKDKNLFIVGCTSGIGLETIKIMAKYHANITLLARDITKLDAIKNELMAINPDIKINILSLDMSKRDSIEEFVKTVINQHLDIDYLYLNAGVYNLPYQVDENGFERTVKTNYIGNYILLSLLTPYLESLNHEVKVLFQISLTYKYARINYEDFFLKNHYSKFYSYANSKRCNVHLYKGFKERHINSNVKVLLTHPGSTYTPLIIKAYPKWLQPIAKGFMNLFFHSAIKASLCGLYSLTYPIQDYDYVVGPSGLIEFAGKPKIRKIKDRHLKDYEKTLSISQELTNLSI